jgi:hypothetical protein
MTAYQEFKDLTIRHFKEAIEDYDFEVENTRLDEIQLNNDNCIVRFIYMEGMVVCDFIDPAEKKMRQAVKRSDGFPSGFPIYSLYLACKSLYPEYKLPHTNRDEEIESQIIGIKQLLLDKLTQVLKGDFSWTTAYK